MRISPPGIRGTGARVSLPAQLATVSVLQFLHSLSDRQAAEAVRRRIEVKYALGLELDDPAFITACWAISVIAWRTWTGYLAHVTETCDDEGTNVITDVATVVWAGDIKAMPGIHQRLAHRRLLPAQHLADAGYTSAIAIDDAARAHNTELVWGRRAPGTRTGTANSRPVSPAKTSPSTSTTAP